MGSTANKGIRICICETEKAGKGARKDGLCMCVRVLVVCGRRKGGGRWSELRSRWKKGLPGEGCCEDPETQPGAGPRLYHKERQEEELSERKTD